MRVLTVDDSRTILAMLHHTLSTFTAFEKVSCLARPGGKFFLWLYHWPRTFVQGWIKRPIG